MLQFLPLPIFTCGCSALDAVRITAKPKAAFSRLCFETALCPGKDCAREGRTLHCSPGTLMCWGGRASARVGVPPWGAAGWPGRVAAPCQAWLGWATAGESVRNTVG